MRPVLVLPFSQKSQDPCNKSFCDSDTSEPVIKVSVTFASDPKGNINDSHKIRAVASVDEDESFPMFSGLDLGGDVWSFSAPEQRQSHY